MSVIPLPNWQAMLTDPNGRATRVLSTLLTALAQGGQTAGNDLNAQALEIAALQAAINHILNNALSFLAGDNTWTGNNVFDGNSDFSGGSVQLPGWVPTLGSYAGQYNSLWTAYGSASNINAVITPKGYGALIGGLAPDGASGGYSRGSYALDWQTFRRLPAQVASGYGAVAVGNLNTAGPGYELSAVGYHNTASGDAGSAFGHYNTASGYNSSGFGHGNRSGGLSSSAFGSSNYAKGDKSSAFGYNNSTYGAKSLAVGYLSQAHAAYSAAVGYNCVTQTGYTNASAFGNQAVCDRNNAFAIGQTGGERQLIHVLDGTMPTDGATLAQVTAGDAATLTTAEAFATSAVSTEATARIAGDAATLSSADAYTDAAVATKLTIPTGSGDTTNFARGDGTWSNILTGTFTVGPSANAATVCTFNENLTGATSVVLTGQTSTVQSDVTTQAIYQNASLRTAAANFMIQRLYGFRAVQGTIGAGSTVIAMAAFNADSTLANAQTVYGFRGSVNKEPGSPTSYAVGTITNVSVTTNVATITAANSYTVGQFVTVAVVTNSQLNGTFAIASASGTQFTYNITTPNVGSTADTGTVTPSRRWNIGCDGTGNSFHTGRFLFGTQTDNFTDQVQVSGNINLVTAGNKLKITEGSGGSVGQATLVSGTKAITIAGVSTSTRAFTSVAVHGGTAGTRYKAVCTTNTLTLTAIDTSGATVTTDTSTLNYFIIN